MVMIHLSSLNFHYLLFPASTFNFFHQHLTLLFELFNPLNHQLSFLIIFSLIIQ